MGCTHLKEIQKTAPDLPGVYTFKDKDNQPLYIGKAKSLKKRLASHLQNPSTAGGESLLSLAYDIDWVICDTEWQALLLEQSSIAREQPRFNVRLRSGHNYPFIAISLDEEFPRVYLSREKRKKGRVYFGPYESKYARKLLDILGRVFQYRTCDGEKPGRRSGSPCLDYSIERCTGPCAGYISKEDYKQDIEKIIQFLSGKQKDTLASLEQSMRAMAQKQEFEKAAAIRDRLQALQEMVKGGKVAGLSPSSNFDALGFATFEKKALIQLLVVREGTLQERRSYSFDNPANLEGGEIVREFLLRSYEQHNIPSLIAVPEGTPGGQEISQYLQHVKKAKVEVRPAQKGQAKSMVDLACKNAKLGLQKQLLRREGIKETVKDTIHSATVDLAGYLKTEKVINRIECYDISNLGPSHTVAAMVVFENGELLPSDYRRFAIKSTLQNDFAAMNEALSRRVKSYQVNKKLDQTNKHRDPSFARLPDLIVIDGGKGQLSAGMEALEPFVELGVQVVALAKREEEIFLPGKSKPLLVEKTEPVSLLLQQIRDETHRFVINYHRTKRDKAMIVSELDQIQGLGPKRRAALIKAFGTPNAVKKAPLEDLEKVVPKKLAQTIYQRFHPANVGKNIKGM